jgi:hypothetical protein
MSQIAYPFTAGQRHSPASAELRFGKPINGIVVGWTSIEYSAKLEPEPQYGNHPDPIGYTLGRATYEASIEVYLAEFKQQLLDALGPGWAVTPFDMTVTYSENGFDTFTDAILGCRLTGFEMTIGNDAAGLKRKLPMKVLKILTNNVDMLKVPLTGAAT